MTNEMRFFFQHSLSNSLNLFPIFDRQKLRKTQKTTSTSLISPPVGPTTSEEKSWSGQHFIGTGSRSKGWKVDGHCYQGGNMGLVFFFFFGGGCRGYPTLLPWYLLDIFIYIYTYVCLSLLFNRSFSGTHGPFETRQAHCPALAFGAMPKRQFTADMFSTFHWEFPRSTFCWEMLGPIHKANGLLCGTWIVSAIQFAG